MSQVVDIKVYHSDPNHSKIFQSSDGTPINTDEFDRIKNDFSEQEDPDVVWSDVSAFGVVTHHLTARNMLLLKIDFDTSPTDAGKDYDIVRLTFNVNEKEMKTPKKHYCLFGMQYNPEAGHFYLSDSSLDMYIPLIDGKNFLLDKLFEVIILPQIPSDLGPEKIAEIEKEFFSNANSLKSIDELFQKVKFFSSNKVSVPDFDEQKGVSAYGFLSKNLVGIGSDPLAERTFLGSLMAYKKMKDPSEQEDSGEFTFKNAIEPLKDSSDMIYGWLLGEESLGVDVFKMATFYIKFFSLLGNCNIPAGQLNTMVNKCVAVAENVGGLDNDLQVEHSDLFVNVSENIDLLNANPFFNPELTDVLALQFAKVDHLIKNPEDSLDEFDEAIVELESKKADYINTANIADFTSFPEDSGLTGSSVIHESDRDDYNYLIDHLEKHKSKAEVSGLCFDSLIKSVKNVVSSKIVDTKIFEDVLNTIQEKKEIMPKITFLTKQIANALTMVYQGIVTKAFTK